MFGNQMKNWPFCIRLISPSTIILFEKWYQTFATQCFITRWITSKFVKKYAAARRIFNSLLGVLSDDETLRLMPDILLEALKLMLEMQVALI